jgi:hypothetical protein
VGTPRASTAATAQVLTGGLTRHALEACNTGRCGVRAAAVDSPAGRDRPRLFLPAEWLTSISILADVAAHFDVTREELAKRLFGS